ncbi:MAG: hypothetical protein ABH864_05940 [archaeon]
MTRKTLREFMEGALNRDSCDLASDRKTELKSVLGALVPERDPNSLYYYFWPARKITSGRARNLIQAYFGAEGYRCITLAEDMYAFHKPDELVQLVSVNREEIGGDELIVVCESEIQSKGGENNEWTN